MGQHSAKTSWIATRSIRQLFRRTKGSIMTERGTREGIDVSRMVLLHLVLAYNWYDETVHGSKRIEYRAMTPRWRKLIFNKRDEITHVRFARGYTATMQTYEVEKIDVGSCPLDGWNDQYFRIHFKQNAKDQRP